MSHCDLCDLTWEGPWTDCPGCLAQAGMKAIADLKAEPNGTAQPQDVEGYGNARCDCGHLSSRHACNHETCDYECWECGCEHFVISKKPKAEPNGTAESPRHPSDLPIAHVCKQRGTVRPYPGVWCSLCMGEGEDLSVRDMATRLNEAASAGVSAATRLSEEDTRDLRIAGLRERVVELKDQCDALTESIQQLRSYVQHKAGCNALITEGWKFVDIKCKCTCGLDDVLKAIGGK